MAATEQVILVDLNDQPVGFAEKMQAHRENLCHRAFSIFIFRKNPGLELLLQQRSAQKYHSPLLWTNTCCSHPRPNEGILQAGLRRLPEEMNISADLKSIGYFHYTAAFDNGLYENEVDYVLYGFVSADQIIHPNPEEAANHRWISIPALQQELKNHPQQFTPWLPKALTFLREQGVFNDAL